MQTIANCDYRTELDALNAAGKTGVECSTTASARLNGARPLSAADEYYVAMISERITVVAGSPFQRCQLVAK
jgi:hypothetical protein